MSVHGICYDNGQSGNCNTDCEKFQKGDCPEEDTVRDMYPTCMECRFERSYYCDHPRATQHTGNVDVEDEYDDESAPEWCPLKNEEQIMTENKKFNFDESSAQVKNNAVNAFDTAKNMVIHMQQGKAVLTAVKAALIKAPVTNDSMKLLLSTPYGDLIVGLVLHTLAPVLTGSPTIIKAVKAANVAGAVEISSQFTFIQDSIEAAIASVPGFSELKDMTGMGTNNAKPKVDEPIVDIDE